MGFFDYTDEDLFSIEETGGTALAKIKQRIAQEQEELKFRHTIQQQRSLVAFDAADSALLDQVRYGIIDQEEARSALLSSQRQRAAVQNDLRLQELQESKDLLGKHESIQRFFALSPEEIERIAPKDGGFRSEIVLDEKTGTFVQRVKANLDEKRVRRQEIAHWFDVPEEAVDAKRDQFVATQAELQKKGIALEQTQRTQQRTALRDEVWKQQQAAKITRQRERRAFEQTEIGQDQLALRRTRALPTSRLAELLEDPSQPEETRALARRSLSLRQQAESIKNEQDVQKFKLRHSTAIMKQMLKDAQTGFIPPEYRKKDGTLDIEKAQRAASQQAEELAGVIKTERTSLDLLNMEQEYGPGGLYDEALSLEEE